MPTQLYSVNGKRPEREEHKCADMERRLLEAQQQQTAAIIPVLRQEMGEVESRMADQLAQFAHSYESMVEQINMFHGRIQTLEKEKEKNVRKRPALRLSPELPITTTEPPRGYHEPTAASAGHAVGGAEYV